MNVFNSIRNWQSTRSTTKQLRSLSARQLEDDGLSRDAYRFKQQDLPFIK